MKSQIRVIAFILLPMLVVIGCSSEPVLSLNEQLVNDALELSASKVKASLKRGADVDYQYEGMTALMGACMVYEHDRKAGREIVQVLLEAGANVNLRNADGATALGWAANVGELQLVTILVENGADVNAADDNGRTALSIAEDRKDEELIAYLHDALSGH